MMAGVAGAAGEITDVREAAGGIRRRPALPVLRAADTAWVCEGADAEILLGEPLAGLRGEPPQVAGSEVAGCAGWHACGACPELIETGNLAGWAGLLARYGDPDVPMSCSRPGASSGRTTGRPGLPHPGMDIWPPPSPRLRDRRPLGRLHRR